MDRQQCTNLRCAFGFGDGTSPSSPAYFYLFFEFFYVSKASIKRGLSNELVTCNPHFFNAVHRWSAGNGGTQNLSL